MNSNSEWNQEEQGRLEEGMLKSIGIIDSHEKWKAIASFVGTRSASECAERFQACRAMARCAAEEGVSPESSESGDPVETQDTLESSGDRAGNWSRAQAWNSSDWKGGWWKKQQRWDSNWWNSSESWQDNTWEEVEANETEVDSLDEAARRAIEMRKEVEANRERTRLREERRQQLEKQQGAKREKEIEEKRQKHLEHVAAKEKEFRDAIAKKEAMAAQQKQKTIEAKREAERTDIPFFGQHNKVAMPKSGWAAKAGASKGELQRQRKQAEMERKAAEVLANIGMKEPEEKPDDDEAPIQTSTSSSSSAIPQAISRPPQRPKDDKSSAGYLVEDATVRRKDAKKQRKRWWEDIDSSIVCPISLAPISELPRAPFLLETDGSADPHYFDARFLANFLVSAFDFIDPVNRRPLTQEECRALDTHLQRNHPEDPGAAVSVADAFALFTQNRRSGEGETDDRVQREATAVLQHLFRFQSARRTDQRGRAINYNDGGLTVVDDDDILTRAPDPPPSFDRCDEDEEVAFPDLCGSTASTGHANTSSAWRGKAKGCSRSSAEFFPGLPPSAKAKSSTSSKANGPPTKAKAKAAAPQSKGRGGGRAKEPLRVGPKGWGTPS